MHRARLRVLEALLLSAALFVGGQQSSTNGQNPQRDTGKTAGPGISTDQKDLRASAADPVNYAREIAPLLNKYCTTCHGGQKPKGDFSLEFKTDKDVDAKLAKDRQFFERMAEKVNSGEMPPAIIHRGKSCPCRGVNAGAINSRAVHTSGATWPGRLPQALA